MIWSHPYGKAQPIDETTQLIDKVEVPQVLSGYLTEIIEKGRTRLSASDPKK